MFTAVRWVSQYLIVTDRVRNVCDKIEKRAEQEKRKR